MLIWTLFLVMLGVIRKGGTLSQSNVQSWDKTKYKNLKFKSDYVIAIIC